MSTADDLDCAFGGLQFRISNARKQHWLASDNHQQQAAVKMSRAEGEHWCHALGFRGPMDRNDSLPVPADPDPPAGPG
jgi:hypothetical protein